MDRTTSYKTEEKNGQLDLTVDCICLSMKNGKIFPSCVPREQDYGQTARF